MFVQVKDFVSDLRCRVGLHEDLKVFVENFRADSDERMLATVGWEQCDKCGYSKLIFFYGNGDPREKR